LSEFAAHDGRLARDTFVKAGEEKDELAIYLFEAATGDVVWSCRGNSDVERSLASLENAVPAALIKP
jgi:hypothetical protein